MATGDYRCESAKWDSNLRMKTCNRDGYEGTPCEGDVRHCELPQERHGLESRRAVVNFGSRLNSVLTEYP